MCVFLFLKRKDVIVPFIYSCAGEVSVKLFFLTFMWSTPCCITSALQFQKLGQFTSGLGVCWRLFRCTCLRRGGFLTRRAVPAELPCTGLVAPEKNKLQTASLMRGMSFVGQVQSRDRFQSPWVDAASGLAQKIRLWPCARIFRNTGVNFVILFYPCS